MWRPILAENPIYTLGDLKTWVTLKDVYDANEAMDLRSAMAERAMARD